MNPHYQEKLGLDRYARVDEGSSVRIQNYAHKPSWFGAYVHCLKHGDFHSAVLIRSLNDPKYAAGIQDGRLAQIQQSNEMFKEMAI